MMPSARMEYMAPFLSNAYFLMRSMFPIVIQRTMIAPNPFPRRMRGTDMVKANAPRTPSIENVMSMTSR